MNPSATFKIALLGSSGRMGTRVSHLLQKEYTSAATLVAQGNRESFTGATVKAMLSADAIVDFSSPSAMAALAREALGADQPLPAFVVGSTGWKPEEYAEVEKLARKTAVLVSSNFSTGVLLLAEILKNAAPLFKKLGYSPVITETHHRHKKDAPSGTALLLHRAITSGGGPDQIQTHSIRAGEIIGDHAVTYYGPADTLTLSHHAMDRDIFARGALDVALWLAAKKKQDPALCGLIGIDLFLADLKKGA
jgi:4-hydroxy-tetrahydrodipicolinate reductase